MHKNYTAVIVHACKFFLNINKKMVTMHKYEHDRKVRWKTPTYIINYGFKVSKLMVN